MIDDMMLVVAATATARVCLVGVIGVAAIGLGRSGISGRLYEWKYLHRMLFASFTHINVLWMLT